MMNHIEGFNMITKVLKLVKIIISNKIWMFCTTGLKIFQLVAEIQTTDLLVEKAVEISRKALPE